MGKKKTEKKIWSNERHPYSVNKNMFLSLVTGDQV